MQNPARFRCPSAALALRALLKQTRRALFAALAAAVALHASLTGWGGGASQKPTARPLTTHFVKRQPRLTKPLELKKRPQPRRRDVRRTMVAVKAQANRVQAAAGLRPSEALLGFARPAIHVGRGAGMESRAMEPETITELIAVAREPRDVLDVSLELLDIEALDTGKYHALVVQDPADKRSIRGFCHLAIVYSRTLYPPPSYYGWLPEYSFESYILPGFLRIPAIMNEHTDIKTDILGRLGLDDEDIFKVPWLVFVGRVSSIDLTPREFEGLGKYITSGGFVFGDAGNHLLNLPKPNPGYMGLSNCLLKALATQGVAGSFERLPNSHPIYHCYFDFDGPPGGGDMWETAYHPDIRNIEPYLEGLVIEGRLVVLLSGKWYVVSWTAEHDPRFNPLRAHQFAVNTIVFALTQEGSITNRLLDSIRY